MMNEALLNAYQNTRYCVFEPPIEIRIGEHNSKLNELLMEHGQVNWAFITAYNPYSHILSGEENKERHSQLINAVRTYTYFEGEGIGEDPSWQPEKSLLIIGITEENAISIGRKFEQNAIVIGSENQSPSLKVTK